MSDETRLRLERTEWHLACLKAENERDAAIAERDKLREQVALRDDIATMAPVRRRAPRGHVVARLDAILRGES